MSDAANGHIGSVGERPTESILGIGYSLLVSAEETGGAYEVMKFVVPAGHGPPPHMHRREAECFYIVDGEFDVTIGDETLRAKAGSYAHLPPNKYHSFRNVTVQTATFLCWVVPGNLAGFFDAFKRDWAADSEQPDPVNDEDIQKMMAAAQAFDIDIKAP